MVKSLVSMILVSIVLFAGSILESSYVKNQFEDFHSVLEILYEKVDDNSATKDDVYAVQNHWLEKKRILHAFIPHNEIKEIDLWLAETVTLVRDKEWNDAISKVEVLKELTEQIPKTFVLSWENIL